MGLPTVWFVAVVVLWTGYFVLEGFDFGVGILMPVLSRDDADRRVVINSIGPVWDGNEVWLITALGVMFAAFPAWYAGLLSGFYLPVLLIVLALIVRGVAFEYRGKRDSPQWKARWDVAIVAGSAVPAFGWGLIFAAVLQGVPLGQDGVVRVGIAALVTPFGLLGGLTTLSLFTLHGAFFLALKTDGAVRHRALRAARRTAPVATAAVFAFLVWMHALRGPDWVAGAVAVATAALLVAAAVAARRREGWAFAATAVTIGAFCVALFGSLFPVLLPSSTAAAFDLTVTDAVSGEYTLGVLTWIGAGFVPLVIAYQSWSYWVFRRRVTRAHVGA